MRKLNAFFIIINIVFFPPWNLCQSATLMASLKGESGRCSRLFLEDKTLRWDVFRIDLTRHEVEKLISQKLTLSPVDLGDGYYAEIDFPGLTVGHKNATAASRIQSERLYLVFNGNDSQAMLQLVHVSFSPDANERPILKKRIGNFETVYEDEESGTYRIASNPDLIVVLKSDGLWFGYESSFD